MLNLLIKWQQRKYIVWDNKLNSRKAKNCGSFKIHLLSSTDCCLKFPISSSALIVDSCCPLFSTIQWGRIYLRVKIKFSFINVFLWSFTLKFSGLIFLGFRAWDDIWPIGGNIESNVISFGLAFDLFNIGLY